MISMIDGWLDGWRDRHLVSLLLQKSRGSHSRRPERVLGVGRRRLLWEDGAPGSRCAGPASPGPGHRGQWPCRVRITDSWLCWVWIEPIPVTVVPDEASAAISFCPPAPGPMTSLTCQFTPLGEVHTAASCRPGWPYWPAAVKPLPDA